MRTGKDLIGKPIYSLTNGQHLGSVKDLYLDPAAESVVGLYLGQEGLISRKTRLILRDSVSVIGVDAMLTGDEYAVMDDKSVPEMEAWLRREELQGREIHTPGGTKVGTVGDVLLDDEARVVGFSLARAFVEGPVAEKRLVMSSAVVDSGGLEGLMTVDLARAERPELAAKETAEADASGEAEELAPDQENELVEGNPEPVEDQSEQGDEL